MRKLLLITNLFVLIFYVVSCRSNSKTITKNETKAKPSTSASNVDTTKHTTQTSTAGTTNATSGIKKDSITQTTNGNAINHSSPNQAQLDSIKAIKTKDKTKKEKP